MLMHIKRDIRVRTSKNDQQQRSMNKYIQTCMCMLQTNMYVYATETCLYIYTCMYEYAYLHIQVKPEA